MAVQKAIRHNAHPPAYDSLPMTSRHLLDMLLLAALWGASFLFMRVAVPEFGAVPLITVRVGIAALFLIAVILVKQQHAQLKGKALPLAVLGLINSAIPFSLFAYSTLFITAGFAAVLNSTAPLFGALIAFVWLKERLPFARLIGLLVGFTGVAVLLSGKVSFKPGGGGFAALGALFAAFLYGIAANYTKQKLTGVKPLVTATGSQIAATLMMLPFAVALWPSVTPSLKAWLSVLALGVFCTAIAYLLFFRLLEQIGPSKTITVTYLIPLFGISWGALFLEEAITLPMLIGGSIILTGTALATGFIGAPKPETVTKPATTIEK